MQPRVTDRLFRIMAGFDSWLIDMLNSKSIDGEVFGEYISGTLNTMEDSSQNEIEEALTEILSGCVVRKIKVNAVRDFGVFVDDRITYRERGTFQRSCNHVSERMFPTISM